MIQMADKNHQLECLRTLVLCYFSQVAKNVLVTTFLVNHIFSSKYMFTCYYPASKYRSLERPEEVPSNVPRTSHKHAIWPSRGRYHLTFWGSPNLTSQGHPESTSWGCVLVGVLCRLLDRPKFNYTFFSKLSAILRGAFRTHSRI